MRFRTQQDLNAATLRRCNTKQRDVVSAKMAEMYIINTFQTYEGATVVTMKRGVEFYAVMPDGSIRGKTQGKNKIEWSWPVAIDMDRKERAK